MGPRSLALVLVLLALSLGCGEDAPATEADVLAQKLDRTSVHLAVVMHEALARSDADRSLRGPLEALRRAAPDLARTPHEQRAADAAWAQRERGREQLASGQDRELEPIVAGARSDWSRAADRTALLLAMIALDAHPDPRAQVRATKSVLLYEASRVDPERAGPELAPLAHALRASTFARAGLCQMARADADAALAAEPSMSAAGASMLLVGGTSERAWVGAAVRALAHGAQACCAVRRGRQGDAAAPLEALVADAREVGSSQSTIALLETWIALARADGTTARERLGEVADLELTPEETVKYNVLRDRLASGGGERELGRTLDRAWIGTTSARVASQAMIAAGALDAIDRDETGRTASTARAITGTLRAAREAHPGFEQAADEGSFWGAVTSLF